jgi:hypothetical protein
MSSNRHGTRAELPTEQAARWIEMIQRRLGGGGAVLLALACGGCFGDWVSARPRPRPRADGGDVSASAKLDLGAAAGSCETYLAAVAERCGAVLDGHLGHCHRELVRVMALWDEDDPRAESREAACTQQLRALPEAPRSAPGAELGPECRAWAEALRERCVAPLSSIAPDLRGCGPDLLAFESTLGAITFGGPQEHEPSCRDAVLRLRASP